MNITQVRVFPVEDDKLKAFVSVIFDDCFVVSDIKIIEGQQGLFISMPSKKRKNGSFRDIAHPLNNETRRRFEEEIIASYREMLDESGDALAPIRDLEEIEDSEPTVPTPFAVPPPPSRGPDSSI
jgi:stage V sporulation protein G